jgi:hypothetical protein
MRAVARRIELSREDPRVAAGIGESQKFDQMMVDWRRNRLHEEDLLATHRVEQLHGNIAVRIPNP